MHKRTSGKNYVGTINDGLRHLVVTAFRSLRGRAQSIPNLLTSLKRWCSIPELITFLLQLGIVDGLGTAPPCCTAFQWLVFTNS